MKGSCVLKVAFGFVALAWLAAGCDVGQGPADNASGAVGSDDAAAGAAAKKTTAAPTPAKSASSSATKAAGKTAEKSPKAAVTAVQSTPPASSTTGKEYVVLTTKDGEIVIELRDGDAPKHCTNFRNLVRSGFYSNKTFHRVIEDFIAQAGDPNPAGFGTGSQGAPVPPEIKLPHRRGAVGMARLQDSVNPNRNSYGSQFYICLADVAELDTGGYTVFGQVVKGMDVAGKISRGDFEINNGIVPPAKRTKILAAEIRKMEITPEATATPDSGETDPGAGGEVYVVLETDVKSGDGKIVIDLFEESAPKHAANFKKLLKQGFYNNLTFHRVIEGFMAQGGDPEGTGSGGPGYTLEAEIGQRHLRGSLSAARLGDGANPERRSSGSQFFICFNDAGHLDRGGYSVFGHVVRGMSVVDKITHGSGRGGAVALATRTKISRGYLVPASSVQVETPSPVK